MELKLKLEFIIKLLIYISQSTGNQQNQSYIVKWCSLCFLAETEMDAIKKAFNQGATPSCKNFDT